MSLTRLQRRVVAHMEKGAVLCVELLDGRSSWFFDDGPPVHGLTGASLLRRALVVGNDDSFAGAPSQTYRLAPKAVVGSGDTEKADG